MLLRRGHLYFGLFLFPWAIMYGVTAFLFNHPTVWSDQAATSFDLSAFEGTPLAELPIPDRIAEQVVHALNETQQPPTPYTVVGPARFGGRDFAFGTAKGDGQQISFLIDLNNGTGTIRCKPVVEQKELPKAPFNVLGSTPAVGKQTIGLKLEEPYHELLRTAMATVLERKGFPARDIVITSVPDVLFSVNVGGQTWQTSYNPMTGNVIGTANTPQPASDVSWRRYLLRLHTAHGYPGDVNQRWFWAIIVDAMAFTMCFWGITGLIMWWQIKATRTPGLIILTLSTISATTLAIAMNQVIQ